MFIAQYCNLCEAFFYPDKLMLYSRSWHDLCVSSHRKPNWNDTNPVFDSRALASRFWAFSVTQTCETKKKRFALPGSAWFEMLSRICFLFFEKGIRRGSCFRLAISYQPSQSHPKVELFQNVEVKEEVREVGSGTFL